MAADTAAAATEPQQEQLQQQQWQYSVMHLDDRHCQHHPHTENGLECMDWQQHQLQQQPGDSWLDSMAFWGQDDMNVTAEDGVTAATVPSSSAAAAAPAVPAAVE
jgi:hypothetical protein